MIKVILVDDLVYFRKALVNSIDWQGLGLDLCGEAGNGQEAYELIKKLEPDIAVVDINMPLMDGLELAGKLKEEGIKTRIIIVTGYNEFEYARQAVQLGTFNYILKPVDNDELIKSLLELKKSIENEKEIDNKISLIRQELKKTIPVLKENFLLELLSGKYTGNPAQILEKFKYFNIFQDSSLFRVVLVDIDDKLDTCSNEEDRQLWRFAVSNICNELAGCFKEAEVFNDHFDRICIIPGSERDGCELQDLQVLCEKIRYSIQLYLKFTVTLGVGELREGLSAIISFVAGHRQHASKRVVVDAMGHIDEKYSNEDLCLESIAGSVFTNPTYLSSIFKNLKILLMSIGFSIEINQALSHN